MEYPDSQSEDLEQAMEVRMAFEALPEELREVAVLYFQQEQKQKDIARILGIGLPLVKYRIRKIREWMAEYLEI
nr:sigma-70 family RNA polymerase sigma factor [uncultured Schaedlerella sp.]